MLEPLSKDDFQVVSTWMVNPIDHEKICGNAFAYPLSMDQYLDYFVQNAGVGKNRLCFKYVHDNKAAGMASFTRIDKRNEYGHIGIVAIDPSLRSEGIGSSMLEELISMGFNNLSLNRVDLFVVESNKKAYEFYTRKIGFKDEGLIREIIKVGHEYLSWYSLSILKHEWFNRVNK